MTPAEKVGLFIVLVGAAYVLALFIDWLNGRKG